MKAVNNLADRTHYIFMMHTLLLSYILIVVFIEKDQRLKQNPKCYEII